MLNVVPTYDQPEGERTLRLGKTYGNLMVDVIASNAKLQNRARSAVVIVRRALARDAAP